LRIWTRRATADVVWQFANLVGEKAGSDVGLGCSSNGAVAVCTYNGNANTTPDPNDEHDNVVAYDYSGQVQWTSGNSINLSAYTSAPLILEEGLQSDVVAVDNMRAIRFNGSNGQEVWNTLHGGGTPVSPVITDSGVILLANIGGPVTAIDSVTGDPLATDLFQLQGDGNDDYFETHKTVAVRFPSIFVFQR
jgi:outer membrane protein assembly factor BamB